MAAQPDAADLSNLVGSWTLDPVATSVVFHTRAMWGLVKVKGTFTPTSGGGAVAGDGAVTGSLVLAAGSVDTGNKKRDEHLRGTDFFDVAAFPTLTFDVSRAVATGAGAVEVEGTLSIHGQTRPLTLTARAHADGDGAVIVDAEADIDRRQWGLTWAKLGAKVDNHVVVHARFTRA